MNPIQIWNSQSHSVPLLAGLCLVVIAGCSRDNRDPDWNEFGPEEDADTGDTGTDVQETDVQEVGPCDPEFLPQLSNESPAPERDIDPIPDRPPENAHCNDEGWCWIHPTPFPQRVTGLRQGDGQILGVAEYRETGFHQGVIWDGQEMELYLPDSLAPSELIDMTTTEDGWLGLGEFGEVHDIRPDGIHESMTLERRRYTAISGNSMDDFMVAMEDDWKVVVDGEVEEGPRVTRGVQSRIWPNGDMVSVDPIEQTEKGFDGRWTKFPAPTPIFPDSAVGPRPGGACGASYPAIGSRRDLLTWSGTLPWQVAAESEEPLTSVGCSTEGRLLVGDQRGTLFERSGDECPTWDASRVLGQPISDTLVAGSKMYVAGTRGAHAIVEDGAAERLGSGLSLKGLESEERGLPYIGHIRSLEDGSQLAILDPPHWFVVTPSGVTQRREVDSPDRPNPAFADQAVGGERPKFIEQGGRLYERRPLRWVDRTDDVIQSEDKYASQLVGQSANDVWLEARDSHRSALYHYNGEEWSSVELPEDVLDVGEMEVGPDGTLYLSPWNDHYLYKRTQPGRVGSWVQVAEVPLRSIDDLFIDAEGVVWTLGEHGVVRYIDGEEREYGTAGRDFKGILWGRLVPRSDGKPPLVAAPTGIYEPQPNGRFELQLAGDFRGGTHFHSKDLTLVFTADAIAAHYDDL